MDPKYYSPCTTEQTQRYAEIVQQLLAALDREIVYTALLGDCQADLLNPEGQEMRCLSVLPNIRVAAHTQPTDLRRRGLEILDAFADSVGLE